MRIRLIAAAAFLALAGSFATAAIAPVPQTLDDLEEAGSTGITVGDKTFYDFSNSGSIDADSIQIVTIPGPNVGVEFRFNWTSTNGANQDTVIHYKVHVNDPARSITGVGLHFDGNVTGSTSPVDAATVTETVSDLNGNQLGQVSVLNSGAFPMFNQVSNTFVVTPPATDLMLDKDIMVHTGQDTGGTATISLVDNTFQQTSAVPLPPAALTAAGTLLLGAFAPLRRKVRRVIGA